MNVGKDPFPRDEVTGLGAFEHLEPVGTISVISEKSRETPVLPGAAAVSGDEALGNANPNPKAVASSNSNAEREPVTRPRGDATLPLDLSAMPHWRGGRAAEQVDTDAEDEKPTSAKPTSALDALFDKSAGLSSLEWEDDDEATRVHSRPAGRSTSDEGNLEMEWDDDEPPTETLPFALLDAPPIAARLDLEPVQAEAKQAKPAWSNVSDDQTSLYLGPRAATSIRSATPTIRTTTPTLELHHALPTPELGSNVLNGGRPSPFPAALDASTADHYDDDSDDDYDSAFNNLMPLPAPQLPAPQPAAPARRRVTPVAPVAPVTKAPVAAEREQAEKTDDDTTPLRFIDALKVRHRPSVIIAAVGALGLIALVVIARAIALTTNIGAALLEVSPADAQVEVDGKSVAGSGSPYTVSELLTGSHELRVKKRGYNDYHGSFAVSAGQSTKLPVIELAPNLLDVGFSVRSVPAGATVWLDGERTEALTPAKLTGITPGIHRLALKHDGFSDYELQMFVPEATVLQLPAAELVAVPGADAEPAANGRRRSRNSRADDADSRKSRGSRASSASTETLTSVSARHSSSGYGSRSSRRDADDDLIASAAPSFKSGAADAAASGKTAGGTLRLNSRPWAQVSVDGRPVGNTPQPNLQLSAGKHKILLANPQLGISKNVTVTIKAGETSTQVVNLAD